MAVLKLNEWESNGKWHCADVSDLAGGSSMWYHEWRASGLSLDNYITKVFEEYHAELFLWNEEKDLLIFVWEKQSDMRRYKNWLNAQARRNNYII